MRKQLRLSGSGGQGVITAAIIFAEAAVAEEKNMFLTPALMTTSKFSVALKLTPPLHARPISVPTPSLRMR